VGREGTAVLFGGNVAQIALHKLNCSPQEKSIWIRAGMAAGFSSIFGTPLAGCFFGLEIGTVGKIHWPSLIACFSASFLANFISLHVWGTKHVVYPLIFLPQISMLFWAKLISIGLFLGIIGLIYKRLESNISKLFVQWPRQAILKGLISGIIILVLFQIPFFKSSIGLGSEYLLLPFQETYSDIEFAGSKLIATTLSLALGFKGGEATPLFLIGSHATSSLSEWIQLPHAFLAAIGFVCLYCGLTKTPITGLCLGIELFGPSAWACYLIVTCLVMFISGNTGLFKSQMIAKWIPKTPYQ
jgi:H+/Cl- antiporter ClcA